MIPFDILVYDNTLICIYQGREDRCSKLRVINFGHQRSEEKTQEQTITFKNLNPTPIVIYFQPTSSYPLLVDLNLNIAVSRPFPDYNNAVKSDNKSLQILLNSGHSINMTFQVTVKSNIVGDM